MSYQPSPADKFSFGLWTVANRGRDPFGEPVRDVLSPVDAVKMLGDVGAWGVNLHDNDLVPIDATASERDKIVKDFKQALGDTGVVVPMATVSLFTDPIFKDGAFTANDPKVRALRGPEDDGRDGPRRRTRREDLRAVGRPRRHRDRRLPSRRRGRQAPPRSHRLAVRVPLEQGYGYRFALEAKPNEPRGDIYMATTGNYLGLIPTLGASRRWSASTPRSRTKRWPASTSCTPSPRPEAGKLFHIDLNDQNPGRYDQDFRFGAANPRNAFFLVKFLEDVGYNGPRHFDAHAYRSEDYDGVKEFASGCMRTYLILKEKAARWNADADIQGILSKLGSDKPGAGKFSKSAAQTLVAEQFDRKTIAARGLDYERLDQLTTEILLGVR